MRYASVCSGVEAASLAWEPLGWQPAWFAEIEPLPSAVLAHRYPHVPNLGDMTAIARQVRSGIVPAPDILVGGTPCQSFSVAGARQGLNDPRGALTLAYVELANAIDQTRHQDRRPSADVSRRGFRRPAEIRFPPATDAPRAPSSHSPTERRAAD